MYRATLGAAFTKVKRFVYPSSAGPAYYAGAGLLIDTSNGNRACHWLDDFAIVLRTVCA
jgi:hypothetical protein